MEAGAAGGVPRASFLKVRSLHRGGGGLVGDSRRASRQPVWGSARGEADGPRGRFSERADRAGP
eukprot:7836896-Lingulodinium_polyedra.AAC.1